MFSWQAGASLELRYLRVLQGWGFARDQFINTISIISIKK
jgi:hypothetical protein